MSNHTDEFGSITTDMRVDAFANKDKLVVSDERKYFDKNDIQSNTKKYHYDSDSDVSNNNGNGNNNNNNNNNNRNSDSESQHSYNSHRSTPRNTRSEKVHTKKSEIPKRGSGIKTETEMETDTFVTKSEDKPHDPEDPDNWTKEETLVRKYRMLQKLGELSMAGVKLSKNYSLNDDYKKMKYEYELHKSIRDKENSVKFISNALINVVQGLELVNDMANPFDMKFNGMWSNNVQSNIENYYECIGDIYEKYSTPGKNMAPELKLFLMVAGGAFAIQAKRFIGGKIGNTFNSADNIDDQKIAEARKRVEREKHEEATRKANDYNMMQQQLAEAEEIKNINSKQMAKFAENLASESMKSASLLRKKKQDLSKENAELEKINKQLEQYSKSQCSESQSSQNDSESMASSKSKTSSYTNPKLKDIIGQNSSVKKISLVKNENVPLSKRRGRPPKNLAKN